MAAERFLSISVHTKCVLLFYAFMANFCNYSKCAWKECVSMVVRFTQQNVSAATHLLTALLKPEEGVRFLELEF